MCIAIACKFTYVTKADNIFFLRLRPKLKQLPPLLTQCTGLHVPPSHPFYALASGFRLQRWGSMMLYRGLECPCLHVKNFVVTLKGKNITKCTKWSELTVRFSAFDYADHASQVAQSSDDEDE